MRIIVENKVAHLYDESCGKLALNLSHLKSSFKMVSSQFSVNFVQLAGSLVGF